MAIKFIDILEPVNPKASAIAKSKQIAGARSVETRADLDTIIPQVLSASYNPANGLHENDAVGQVWYVADENKYYKLKSFSVDNNKSPFEITRDWEVFIDTSITADAIDNRIDAKLPDVDSKIDAALKSGFATQTIFGYDTSTEQTINTNSIYVGGYGAYDGIMIQSDGKLFEFPTDNKDTISTIATLENINSISNSIVKFENVGGVDGNDSTLQKIYTNSTDKSILVLSDEYVKFDKPILANSIETLKDGELGGQIKIPFIESNSEDTFALQSQIDVQSTQFTSAINHAITVAEATRTRLNEHVNNNLIHVYKDYIGYTEYDMTTLYTENINKDNASVLGQTFTLENLVGLNNGDYSNIETGAQYKIDGVTLQVRSSLDNYKDTVPGANVETYVQIFKQHLNSSNEVDGYTHLATSTNSIVWRDDSDNILYSSEEKITWNFNQDVNGHDIVVGTDEQLVLLFNNSPTPNVSFISGTNSFGNVANVSFPLRMVSTRDIDIAKTNLWWIDGYGNVKEYSVNANAIILTIDAKKLESDPYIIVKTQNEDILTKQANDGTQLIDKLSISEKIQSSAVATEPTDVPNLGQVQHLIDNAISTGGTGGNSGSGEVRYVISNSELGIIDGYASWSNVIRYKNSSGVTGIDYTNVPVVQVYDKTTGMICYPDVKLSSATSNGQEYTIVNIIFRSESEPVIANKYVAVIITSAEIV